MTRNYAYSDGNIALKKGFFYKLYNTCLEHANSPKAFWAYLLVAFTESSFFFLPPDLLMIPMGVANKKLVWKLAFWGTVASVAGGLLGYAIGSFFIDTGGRWLIHVYGLEDSALAFHETYKKWGFWIIVLKGLTPIPFKLVTLASGMAHYSLFSFLVASVICRSFRFFLVATLLWFFGEKAKDILDRYLGQCLFISLFVVVIGFFIIKYALNIL